MEGRSERKWKTLRNISSPQGESDGVIREVIRRKEEKETLGIGEAVSQDESIDEIQDRSTNLDLDESSGSDGVRILAVLPSAATTRLIRETIENFTEANVEATSNALRGFELALQKRYDLFFFGMAMEDLDGPLLYELISKTYAFGRGPKNLAPGVVFVRESGDPKLPSELERDVRIKAVISKPIKIERLLESVANVTEVKDPTAYPSES
ncbi:MAG: hypothetical protein AAGA96_18835 [Verrucomicrobiota bacterium]